MSDHSTTDQPAHYADRKVEVIDTIREALGEDGFRAYCRGVAIECVLEAGVNGDAADGMREAAKYARWASGDAWNAKDVTAGLPREPRKVCAQLADPAEPSACIECGNGACEDIAQGYCCKCYAVEYGEDPCLCDECETPPHVADILGETVMVAPGTKGMEWLALVDVNRCGGGRMRHQTYGGTAEGMRAALVCSIRASGVLVPGE